MPAFAGMTQSDRRMPYRLIAALLSLTLLPDTALAATLDGASLRWPWALPFAGILLTIAAGP